MLIGNGTDGHTDTCAEAIADGQTAKRAQEKNQIIEFPTSTNVSDLAAMAVLWGSKSIFAFSKSRRAYLKSVRFHKS